MAIITLNNNSLLDVTELPSGISGQNYPAFSAQLSADQTVSSATFTKVEIDSETFDSDGCYNNTGSTVTLNGISVPSYSFAPNVAGKYFIFGQIQMNPTGSDNLRQDLVNIAKNDIKIINTNFYSNNTTNINIQTKHTSFILDLNGTSDYINLVGYTNVASGTPSFEGDTVETRTSFGAYRIGA
jgi:uncharacterized protein YdgA (DUF945 family)